MLLQPMRTQAETKRAGQACDWPENYFREADPAARRAILDGRNPEKDGPLLEQMRRLFDARYQVDKKGKYADRFLRAWLELRLMAENTGRKAAGKKTLRMAEQALRDLCLDGDLEFPADLLYWEMCHLTAVYVASCLEDTGYTSVIFGFGKKREERVYEEIRQDLRKIGEVLPHTLGMEEDFRTLSAAIADTWEETVRQHG